MVIRAILDTSIIIDLLRNYPPAVLWLNNNQLRDLGITHIVWMETIQGAQNKVERDRAGRLLRQFRLEHSTTDDNNWAIRQHTTYWLSHNVGFTDCMIASVAVRLAVPLYTLNIKHYTPLPNVDEQRPY